MGIGEKEHRPIDYIAPYTLPYRSKIRLGTIIVFGSGFVVLLLVALLSLVGVIPDVPFLVALLSTILFTLFIITIYFNNIRRSIIVEIDRVIIKNYFSQKVVLFGEISEVNLHCDTDPPSSSGVYLDTYLEFVTGDKKVETKTSYFMVRDLFVIIDAVAKNNRSARLNKDAALVREGKFDKIVNRIE